MGYRKLSACPRDGAQDADAIPGFKSFLAEVTAIRAALSRGTPLELRTGRGAGRPEDWHRPALDRAGNRSSASRTTAPRPISKAPSVAPGDRSGDRHASLQYPRHDPAARREYSRFDPAPMPCCWPIRQAGSSRWTSSSPPTSPRCRPNAPCSTRSRTSDSHARQLAGEPRFQIPRKHPRPLLVRLELPHRSAMPHHVLWTDPIDRWVTTNSTLYRSK